MATPARRPVEPAYAALAEKLRAQILNRELNSGDRLPAESELSSLYGVSRSTVREALRALSSQRLLYTTRGVAGGTFVAEPNPDALSANLQDSLHLFARNDEGTVADLLEVRDMLEVPAAALAAERAAPADIDLLRATLFDPRSVDPDAIFQVTRNFHVVVLRLAGNAMLEVVTRPIFGVLQDRFARHEASSRFWHRVNRDHRRIMERIVERDSQGAAEAQREHLQHLRATYLRIDKRRPRRVARQPGETQPGQTHPGETQPG